MRTLLLIALLLMPGMAHATPLEFEFGGQTQELLSAVSGTGPSYGGVTWDSRWAILSEADYQYNWGNTLAFPSGDQVLFNGYGSSDLTVYGQDMLVAGAWFAPWGTDNGWYDPYSAHAVTMDGYDASGALVGSATMALDPGGFHYLATNFGPIDTLHIRTDSQSARWLLMDNFDVTVPTQSSQIDTTVGTVPEPPTWILLFGGLAVIGWKWLRLSVNS